MRCLATNEAAEGDDGVVTTGVGEQRDGRGKLERARDLEEIDGCTCLGRALDRTALERERDLLVRPRANDRDTSPANRGRAPRGTCLSGRHPSHSIGGLAVASRLP